MRIIFYLREVEAPFTCIMDMCLLSSLAGLKIESISETNQSNQSVVVSNDRYYN